MRGEQSTSNEVTALANLTALATSGAGFAIAKTGTNTFANVSVGGSGNGIGIEFLAGVFDGAHFIFTCTHLPVIIFNDGTPNFATIDYTATGAGPYTITFLNVAPNASACSIYNK